MTFKQQNVYCRKVSVGQNRGVWAWLSWSSVPWPQQGCRRIWGRSKGLIWILDRWRICFRGRVVSAGFSGHPQFLPTRELLHQSVWTEKVIESQPGAGGHSLTQPGNTSHILFVRSKSRVSLTFTERELHKGVKSWTWGSSLAVLESTCPALCPVYWSCIAPTLHLKFKKLFTISLISAFYYYFLSLPTLDLFNFLFF